MTVTELINRLGLKVFVLDDGDRDVTGAYSGDLLSWVMGRASEDCAWITIMTNQNVAAVAVLVDVACVILAEGVQPDDELRSRAESQGVNLLGSDSSAYELSWRVHDAISS